MHVFNNKIDFYITNVCNLTCDHCNRFNNHSFKGWQNWHDYADVYETWGSLIDLRSATIMGGEPFLNPTLVDWVTGINRIFGIEVQILTNGTRFAQAPAELYAVLAGYTSVRTGAKNHIGVSLHQPSHEEETIENVRSFLGSGAKIYTKDSAECQQWNADYSVISRDGVKVNAFRVTEFSHSAIIPLTPDRKTGKARFTLHDSNPIRSHETCSFVQFKSYHFIKGALYKCAPAALLKEFDQQHPFEIDNWRRQIIQHGYQPLTIDNFHDTVGNWLTVLDGPIPQCRLCPESFKTHSIFPVRKGSAHVR